MSSIDGHHSISPVFHNGLEKDKRSRLASEVANEDLPNKNRKVGAKNKFTLIETSDTSFLQRAKNVYSQQKTVERVENLSDFQSLFEKSAQQSCSANPCNEETAPAKFSKFAQSTFFSREGREIEHEDSPNVPTRFSLSQTSSSAFLSRAQVSYSQFFKKQTELEREIILQINNSEFFCSVLSKKISQLKQAIEIIDFSPGFEEEKRKFPTIEEFKPVVELFSNIRESFSVFLESIPPKGRLFAENKFETRLFTFITEWMDDIRKVSLRSREAELSLLDDSRSVDLEFDQARIDRHIQELKENKDRPLLQLKELLNISLMTKDMGGVDRMASQKEISLFNFFWKLHQKKTRLH